MAAKRRPRKSGKLQLKRVCGYVAVKSPQTRGENAQAWLYMRKHSETQLFVGNIPEPRWNTTRDPQNPHRILSEEDQTRLGRLIKLMLPCTEQVGEIFSTANGRLATRLSLRGGEAEIDQVLRSPEDHVYMEYWCELHGDEGESLMEKWLREYEDERNEQKVLAWSNAAMKAYEVREKRREEEKERQRAEGAVPDEDGFVTVTEGAKQMKAAEAKMLGTGGRTGKGRYKSKSGKNRKTLLDVNKGIEKVGFYRWQRQNQNVVDDLQKRFKEDKKRIAAIRGLERSAGTPRGDELSGHNAV